MYYNPIFDEEPVFDPEPNDNDSKSFDKTWALCKTEAKKLCPMLIGQIDSTTAAVSGSIVTIYRYNKLISDLFPTIENHIVNAVRNVTGKEYTIRLGSDDQ